jgi:hypothetical protein
MNIFNKLAQKLNLTSEKSAENGMSNPFCGTSSDG